MGKVISEGRKAETAKSNQIVAKSDALVRGRREDVGEKKEEEKGKHWGIKTTSTLRS